MSKKSSVRPPHIPALEPLSRYTVTFVGASDTTHTREIAGTDEVDVAKAVRRCFTVKHITAIVLQGNIYVTPTRR